jgi:hypothetical protein
MKNRYIQVSRVQNSTKKKVIYSSIIIGSIIFGCISAVALISIEASMLGSDNDYSWDVEVGDRFYLAFRDKYTWTDENLNDDERIIRDFKAILKSEILKIEDFAIDLDNDDDLMIMSSFLLGREDLFSFEIPNYFDLYNLLLLGYDISAVTDRETYFNETARLFYPSMPSAVHFVSSGVYHELDQLLEDLNIGNLVESEFPVFNDIADLFNFFRNNVLRLDAWNETFTDYWGGSPENKIGYELNNSIDPYEPRYRIYPPHDYLGINYWSYASDYLDNNSAWLFKRFNDDWGIGMFQDENTELNGKDDLQVNVNIFDAWLNNTEFGEEIELSDYFFRPSQFSFDLDLHLRMGLPTLDNSTNNHTLEIGLIGDPFNITGEIEGIEFDFDGYNGIQFRISNGLLQYNIGNYTYDQSIPFSQFWRPSTSSEKGWHNISETLNLTETFGEDSLYGELMNIEIIPNFEVMSGFGMIMDLFEFFGLDLGLGDQFSYSLEVSDAGEGSESYSQTFESIPLHIDCPFDFLNAKNNDLDSSSVFRWENMSNLYFKMYDTENNQSKDWFDDIWLNGYVYDSETHFTSLMDTFIFAQLFLLSFYHTLFYPKDFDWGIITSVVALMNQMLDFFTGVEGFFTVIEDSNSLTITINNEGSQDLTDWLIVSIMDVLGYNIDYEWINGMEGEFEFDIFFTFDKRINVLNNTYIQIHYLDLGMDREVGMSLVAVATKEGEAKYDQFYPAFPQDELAEQFESIISQSIMGVIISSVVSIGASVGLVELIRYIRKRKTNSRT